MSAFSRPCRATGGRVLLALMLCGWASTAAADQLILGGMSWMTGFPATWNAGAPKVVSDGLHYYAVLCGYLGSSSNCSIARKRGREEWQAYSHWMFTAIQPATLIIDRKGRLNIFFNDPYIHHVRFDHPSVNLIDPLYVSVPYSDPVGYQQASYDPVRDIIMLAFNETTTWRLHFAVKFTDENLWSIAPLPLASPGTMLLYARTLRAQDRYFVLAGEHVLDAINASYTAAVLFESPTPNGPWTRRVLRQAFGDNLGIPYQNWVLANDIQADAAGRVRALLHITENGSGHGNNLNGLYLLREEDGYVPRLVTSSIEDGFVLNVDPSGLHMVFGRAQVPHYHTGETIPYTYTGDIVSFRSDDGGATWGPQHSEVDSATNPTGVELRNGSMLGSGSISMIYSDEVTHAGPWDSVWSLDVNAGIPQTADRYDYQYFDADGTRGYVRAYNDAPSGRYYYYVYDDNIDGSFSITYSYQAGNYCHAYIADSSGNYRYFNSDGFQATVGTPAVVQYSVDDGIHRLHLRGVCAPPARVTNLRLEPRPGEP